MNGHHTTGATRACHRLSPSTSDLPPARRRGRVRESTGLSSDSTVTNGDTPPVWTFQFRPLPSSVPAECRARKLLKHAFRALDFRCVDVSAPPRFGLRKHASIRLTASVYGCRRNVEARP